MACERDRGHSFYTPTFGVYVYIHKISDEFESEHDSTNIAGVTAPEIPYVRPQVACERAGAYNFWSDVL